MIFLILGIACVFTLFSLFYVRKVDYKDRYPNPCSYEFCSGSQLQWGWPLPFYFDQGVNTDSCLGCLSIVSDMKSPVNFLLDVLIFILPVSLFFFFIRKIQNQC